MNDPIVLLQEGVINKALEINPYGTAAIGVLFALLISIVFFLWKEIARKDTIIEEERKYGRELSEKVIVLMTRVGAGFDDDRTFKATLQNHLSEIKIQFTLLDQIIRSGKYNRRDSEKDS